MPWGLYVLLNNVRCIPKRDYLPPWVLACVRLREDFSFCPRGCAPVRTPAYLHAPAHPPACVCVLACVPERTWVCLRICVPAPIRAHACMRMGACSPAYLRDNPPAPYPNSPKLPHSGAHYYAPACIRAFPPFALLLI